MLAEWRRTDRLNWWVRQWTCYMFVLWFHVDVSYLFICRKIKMSIFRIVLILRLSKKLAWSWIYRFSMRLKFCIIVFWNLKNFSSSSILRVLSFHLIIHFIFLISFIIFSCLLLLSLDFLIVVIFVYVYFNWIFISPWQHHLFSSQLLFT